MRQVTAHSRSRTILVLAMAAILGLTACKSSRKSGGGDGNGNKTSVNLVLTPAENATDVPVSAEIGLQVSGGRVETVELADADGAKVAGALRADRSSWVPEEPLNYTTTYTATATAKDDKGGSVSKSTKFTTMSRPGKRMSATVNLSAGKVYGQAMPIVVEFGEGGVAKADRAAVEKRLFVTSDPPQPGAWHWDGDIRVEYRPPDYWQPGTKLKVRLGLGGLPVGGGRYGQFDITVEASIDTVKRLLEVDNASKRMIATQDGQQVRAIPVSLGKPSTPSYSGNMVIMSREDKTVFDSSTYGTPVNSPDGYRTNVKFAERLTYDGQFIHQAEWSVAQQGVTNVSHGCVNISPEHAEWVYNWVKVGDPVIVRGTEQHLRRGISWDAWDMSWDEFVKGSALPPPSAAPSPGGS